MWSVWFALATLAALPAPGESCWESWQRRELPIELEWAQDVRWAAPQQAFWVTAGGAFVSGVDDSRIQRVAAAGTSANELFMPIRLAFSKSRLVVGSLAYTFSEVDLEKKQAGGIFPFWDLGDLDLYGDQLALFGAQRDEEGNYAGDGALAFLGKLGDDPASFRPIYFSEEGPGAPAYGRCDLMELALLRFLEDGSLLVLPGVEGGLLLYDKKGALVRSFTAAEIGFDSGCPIDPKVAARLKLDENGRLLWINTRRVVDDIVPLPGGAAGIILRTFQDGRPTWEMKILRKNGSIRTCPLPLESRAPFTRVRADTLGDQVLFLLSQKGLMSVAGTRTNKLTGEVTRIPVKLHPDEKTAFYLARYLP